MKLFFDWKRFLRFPENIYNKFLGSAYILSHNRELASPETAMLRRKIRHEQ